MAVEPAAPSRNGVDSITTSSASCSDGQYDVSIEVEARKFKADGTGNETEVPVDDWIDIGAFAKPASQRKYGDTLYRQRVHITQRNSAFTVYLRMQDRPPRDGLSRIEGYRDLNYAAFFC